MDSERVQAFFGDRHHFTVIDNFRRIAREVVPVVVRPGGNLSNIRKSFISTEISRRSVGKGDCRRCEWSCYCFFEETGGAGRKIAGVTGRGSGEVGKDKNHPRHDF